MRYTIKGNNKNKTRRQLLYGEKKMLKKFIEKSRLLSYLSLSSLWICLRTVSFLHFYDIYVSECGIFWLNPVFFQVFFCAISWLEVEEKNWFTQQNVLLNENTYECIVNVNKEMSKDVSDYAVVECSMS